jgi:hypothetical protein
LYLISIFSRAAAGAEAEAEAVAWVAEAEAVVWVEEVDAWEAAVSRRPCRDPAVAEWPDQCRALVREGVPVVRAESEAQGVPEESVGPGALGVPEESAGSGALGVPEVSEVSEVRVDRELDSEIRAWQVDVRLRGS